MPKHRPKKTFSIIAGVLVVGLSILFWWLGLHPAYAYLIAVNLAVVLLYGYDKQQAKAGGGRVPEVVLHGAALIGGSPGALLAQGLFRHKTQKLKFRMVFAGIVLLQLVVGLGYWHFFLRAS